MKINIDSNNNTKSKNIDTVFTYDVSGYKQILEQM